MVFSQNVFPFARPFPSKSCLDWPSSAGLRKNLPFIRRTVLLRTHLFPSQLSIAQNQIESSIKQPIADKIRRNIRRFSATDLTGPSPTGARSTTHLRRGALLPLLDDGDVEDGALQLAGLCPPAGALRLEVRDARPQAVLERAAAPAQPRHQLAQLLTPYTDCVGTGLDIHSR